MCEEVAIVKVCMALERLMKGVGVANEKWGKGVMSLPVVVFEK